VNQITALGERKVEGFKMQKIMEQVQKKAAELLQAGTVDQVVAWRRGQFFYDNAPGIFTKATGCADLVYDEFCPANLSKYLMDATKKKLKTAVFLKPCDTYGVNQLLKDNRIDRKYFIALGTPCRACWILKRSVPRASQALPKLRLKGHRARRICVRQPRFTAADVLLDKCHMCKGNAYMIADEEIGEKLPTPEPNPDAFAAVKKIEAHESCRAV
jgi:formate dehydrogenase subunit beta